MRNEELLSTLGKCINSCNYCADACLDEDNVKMMKDCIRTDRVCAEVCSTLNQVLATGYKDVNGLLEYCIRVCNACAEECGKHEHQHCQDCAKACKECASACEAYLA